MSSCSSCCNWKAKAACASVTGILGLTLSIFFFVLLFAYQDTKPATPCAGLWGPVTYLHRGNLTYAQENTFDALVSGSVASGANNVELDVSVLQNDKTVVVFHDETLLRMTGVGDKDIKDVPSMADLPPIQQVIDGYTYPSNNTIPELGPVVEAMCNLEPTVGINFDTKALGAIEESVAALKDSNCNTADNPSTLGDKTIWSTPYPGVVTKAREVLDQNGFGNVRVGMYMPSGEYFFLGLKFMLKTRLLQSPLASKGSSILVLHKTVFDVEQDGLIKDWVDDGWCTGIYGITPDEVKNYNADYYVVDEGPIFPDLPFGDYGSDGEPKETVYDDNSLMSYNWFITLAAILLLASLVLLSYAALSCARARTRAADAIHHSSSGIAVTVPGGKDLNGGEMDV